MSKTRFISRRAAKRRGWEGPFRYQFQHPHHVSPGKAPERNECVWGWIVKRGRKYLHFVSASGERYRVPLAEERFMDQCLCVVDKKREAA